MVSLSLVLIFIRILFLPFGSHVCQTCDVILSILYLIVRSIIRIKTRNSLMKPQFVYILTGVYLLEFEMWTSSFDEAESTKSDMDDAIPVKYSSQFVRWIHDDVRTITCVRNKHILYSIEELSKSILELHCHCAANVTILFFSAVQEARFCLFLENSWNLILKWN